MDSAPVETAHSRLADDGPEIVVIDDLDELGETAIVMGCGDDNPYR